MTEEEIDEIYQGAFNSIKRAAKEKVGVTMQSPDPSVKTFIAESGSVTIELGEGLSYYIGRAEEEVSESEFRNQVSDDEADFLIACAEMWRVTGKQQRQNLSEKYLERYM